LFRGTEVVGRRKKNEQTFFPFFDHLLLFQPIFVDPEIIMITIMIMIFPT